MTDKEKERENKILKVAEAYEQMQQTEGWRYAQKYIQDRIAGAKSKLSKIDLDKERSEAAKTQGEIKAFYSLFNIVSNKLKEAEMIKRKQIKKKE